jgi:hypothetical protein
VELPEGFQRQGEEGGHKGYGDKKDERAFEAPEEEGGGGEDRAGGDAGVAAYAEDAQAGAFFLAGDEVGEPGGFGVERGDADAADGDGQEEQPVGIDEAGGGQAEAGAENARRHEPGHGFLVGQVADERLDDGGDEVGRQDEGGGGGVAEVVLGDEERQDGGQGALVDVGEEMAG